MKQFNSLYPSATVEDMNEFILRKPISKYVFMHYLLMQGKKDDYKRLEKAKTKPPRRDGVYTSKEKLLLVINSIKSEKHQMAALIQFITGARACDILGFDKERAEIVTDIPGIGLKLDLTTKGDKQRIVFIPEQFCGALNEFFARSGQYPFFKSQKFDDITKALETNYHYYYESVRKAAEEAGLKHFATHDFRRNFIDEAYSVFKDIRVVKDLVGHSNIALTFRYLKKRISKEEFIDSIKILRG